MERLEMLESVKVSENGVHSFDDEVEQMDISFKGSENLGVDLLEDLDSYWEDIKERLIISRMVSNSIIKGVINAVEQDAAEKIASKELELANLKDSLHKSIDYGLCVEHDNIRESLESLRNAAREEFKKLKQEINGVKGNNSVRKISSSSELVGLGGILKENENVSWVCVDKTLGNLESVVHTICSTLDDVVSSSKKSIQEMEFQREVEAMVIQSSIRSIQEEFKEKFGDLNASFNWLEKFEEISCLRKELDVILKLLPNQETGQLNYHGSYDMDHSNSNLPWESNGHDESKTGVPDKFDAAQFGHMTKQELVNFFNTTITQMKRDHESIVQLKTEQYYHLKAKYLKEKGSSLPLRKDKESDVLRKKIPEVIMKLDDILVENEKIPLFNVESVGSLKDRIDTLVFENQQLRDLITDKENEVKLLSSQVSKAVEIETNFVKFVENLELSKEDANIEALVCGDVYKSFLKELRCQIKRDNEESYIVLLEELRRKNERTSECDGIEDSDMESLIMQGLCEVIYGESIKEAEGKVEELKGKFERESLEKEKEFRLELEEKEKLREKLLVELKDVEEQLEFASQELNKLRDHTKLQQKLILERSEELNVLKAKLLEAMEQAEIYKTVINGLNEKLEVAMEELKKADEVKKMVPVLSREKENVLLQFEVQEKERSKQMKALVFLVNELLEKIGRFESKVTEDIEGHNSRLENSQYQLSYLVEKVNDLAKTESLYKQKLQRRCSDLEMAEAEVDLLGDEVEALLSLLEKIYIALDHYSPILQHYPGIIEILKLVRSELSGQHIKSV